MSLEMLLVDGPVATEYGACCGDGVRVCRYHRHNDSYQYCGAVTVPYTTHPGTQLLSLGHMREVCPYLVVSVIDGEKR